MFGECTITMTENNCLLMINEFCFDISIREMSKRKWHEFCRRTNLLNGMQMSISAGLFTLCMYWTHSHIAVDLQLRLVGKYL